MRHVLMQSELVEVNNVVSCGSSWGVWCEVRMRGADARCEERGARMRLKWG